MKSILLCVVCAAALGACDRSTKVEAKNATAAEVARDVQHSGLDEGLVSPGLWQSKVIIEKFVVPGMSPEMARRMKSMMAEGQVHDSEICLTAEDVKRPREDFFTGKDSECRYEHFTMGSGKIDAAMRCGREQGVQTMQMAGTYSSDNYEMHMATMATANDGETSHAMQMQMRVEGRRIGECSAKRG